jgi:hypothetical protein
MPNPRETRTNAADSAPGVDDGPDGARAPPINSKPGGRVAVWIGVLVVALIVLATFIARPLNPSRSEGGHVAPGVTQGEVARSQVPGAADGPTQTQPATPQGGGY